MDAMLGTADGFGRDWFASLVYTPLFTRPVIMEMIREWTPHVLREHPLAEGDFIEALEMIVLNQIRRLLNKREMPPIMRKETVQEGYRVPFGDHPLVGHMAIYSINLIVLRLIAGKVPFVFEERTIASHEDGTRPWDRLIHMWRSWFSLGNLNGLTAVMLAERSGESIKVGLKSRFQVEEAKSRLHELYNVALSVGDDVAAGIAGLCLFDPASDSVEKLDRLEKRLSSEDVNVGLAVSIAKLRVFAGRFEDSREEFVEHGRRTLEQAMRGGRIDQLEIVSQIIARTLEGNVGGRGRVGRFDRALRDILPPHFVVEAAMRDPKSARVLYELGRQSWDSKWIFEVSMHVLDYWTSRMPLETTKFGSSDWFHWLGLVREIAGAGGLMRYGPRRGVRGRRVVERALSHPRYFLELVDRNPEGAVAYLQILRELGGGRYFEKTVARRIGPEVIDRMFDRDRLGELIEGNPERALAYVQVLRELGGRRHMAPLVRKEMGPELLKHRFGLRTFLRLMERNPKGTLAYVQVLREVAAGGILRDCWRGGVGRVC